MAGPLLSQNKSDYNWHFGNFAGLNFNTSPTTVSTTSKINTGEGASSMSDSRGNLLFYTDGVQVWDKFDSIMPNGIGLLGGYSSSQSALITPVVGDTNRYYIFTTDGPTTSSYTGLNYIVINMQLTGNGTVVNPRGDLDTAYMRCLGASGNMINLIDSVAEKLTAISHSITGNYWIVTRKYPADMYAAFLVTQNGVANTPSISFVGNNVGNRGCLIASNDGQALVSAEYGNSAQIFDFDRNTGFLSNMRVISTTARDYYGVVFSPNDSLIYVTAGGSPPNSGVYTYQRFAPIISATERHIPYSFPMGGAQIGPNDTIYIARFPPSSLSRIDRPNNYLSPGFVSNGLNLSPGYLVEGMPNLYRYDTIFHDEVDTPNINFTDSIICLGDTVQIGFSESSNLPIAWKPNLFISDTSVASPNVFPAQSIKYYYTLSLFCDDIEDSVAISVRQKINLNTEDTSLCQGDSLTFLFEPTWKEMEWNGILITDTFIKYATGEYYIAVTDSFDCTSMDTFEVDHLFDNLSISGDTLGDTNTTISIDLNGSEVINWSTGDTTNQIAISKKGLYSISVVFNDCLFTDSIYIDTCMVSDGDYYVFIPNSFSPNDDGINDYFKVIYQNINLEEIHIYDRHGKLIFNDSDKVWNGKYLDRVCSEGTYLCYVRAKEKTSGKYIELNKNITLIR